VSLPAVAVRVICALLRGVNVVAQVMLAFTASEATGAGGEHTVVAPAGAPVTVHVALMAGFGPALVQARPYSP
jgi:hypothetical protein